MAQGKAYTKGEREKIIQSLQSYLELGFSRNKACGFIGLTPSNLCNWTNADESLEMKIQSWENAINKLAMQNMVSSINREGKDFESRMENTKWWLERKMKEDFSLRTETTGANGGPQVVNLSAISEKVKNILNDK